jgi:membrane protein involved in colicin uptake
MLKLRADMATNLSAQSDARAKALKKEALAYAKKVLNVEAEREAEAEAEAAAAKAAAAAVAKESETKAAARREEAWELVARLAEAEAAAEEASSREFEAAKTASSRKMNSLTSPSSNPSPRGPSGKKRVDSPSSSRTARPSRRLRGSSRRSAFVSSRCRRRLSRTGPSRLARREGSCRSSTESPTPRLSTRSPTTRL